MSPDFKEFLVVLRRALLMITRWIEKRCDLPEESGLRVPASTQNERCDV